MMDNVLESTSLSVTPQVASDIGKRISVGDSFCTVINSDGRVNGWGLNNVGQCNPPQGLGEVTEIVSGDYYTIALLKNKTLVAWGSNSAGQCNIPQGLTNVVSVATGPGFVLALKDSGTVVGWGERNKYGQATIPNSLNHVKAISAGYFFSIALKANGTVVGWGENSSGQCDVPAGLKGVTKISAGGYHTLALKSDGTVVAWGHNGWKQCNVPANLTNVVSIAAGVSYSLALKSNGTIVSWGENLNGQTEVSMLNNIVAITAKHTHCMAVKNDGSIVVWGSCDFGVCNIPPEINMAWGRLKNLKISDGLLNPLFNSNTLDYFTMVDYQVNNIEIIPYAMDDYPSTIQVQRQTVQSREPKNISLKQGRNTIEVTVKTSDEMLAKYNLLAIRRANALLEYLSIDSVELKPLFDPNTTEYTASVNSNVAEVQILARPADPLATVSVNGVDKTGRVATVPLGFGTNLITIDVKATDNTNKAYFIVITRGVSFGFGNNKICICLCPYRYRCGRRCRFLRTKDIKNGCYQQHNCCTSLYDGTSELDDKERAICNQWYKYILRKMGIF